jgi:pimeloyl-ACP methyl ester carboxylesterase
MGFGFDLSALDAAIDFNSAASDLLKALSAKRDLHPTRPLVFIGHGYGTVMIQRLFSKLNDKIPEWHSLRDSTAAIVLFAPPFGDSNELLELTKTSAKLQSSMAKVLEPSLSKRSMELTEYWNDFHDVAEDPNIFVFGYLSKSAIIDEKFYEVDKERQTIGIKNLERYIDYVDVSLTNDMRNIAKFSGPTDRRFQSMAGLILKKVQTRLVIGAADRGDEDTLACLINRPIEINLSNKMQQTALHIAAQREDIDFVISLLRSTNVPINSRDSEGMTALHRAVLHNGEKTGQIVLQLLKAGADRWVENSEGLTPGQLSKSKNTRNDIKQCFENPPMVEGPPIQVQKILKRTPTGDGIAACEKTIMVVTEMFYIDNEAGKPEGRPEKHSPVSSSVNNLIYSEESIEARFTSVCSDFPNAKPFCRWYHLPANNVSLPFRVSDTLTEPAHRWCG